MWTGTLTCPFFHTVGLQTGHSADAPAQFCVDADTAPLGSEDAAPRSRACVGVLGFPGRVGRAGLWGAFWCASLFLRRCCPPALLDSLRAAVALFLSFCLPSFFLFVFFLFFPSLPATLLTPAFCGFRPWLPLALAPRVFSDPPPAFMACFVFLFCPPSLSLALSSFRPRVSRALALCGPPPFFFLLRPCLLLCASGPFGLLFVSPPPPFPLFFPSFFLAVCGFLPPPPRLGVSFVALLVLPLLLCFLPGLWLLPCGCCLLLLPPPPAWCVFFAGVLAWRLGAP